MKKNINIILPGGSAQISRVLENIASVPEKILVIGGGSEEPGKVFREALNSEIIIIVDDYDSLIRSRFYLREEKNISVRMMDYDKTDFNDNTFDLVYAQGTISRKTRNKIVKEIKRILKPGGLFSAGEVVSLTAEAPVFIKDIWERSAIQPLLFDDIREYYKKQGFEEVLFNNLAHTLYAFYKDSSNLLNNKQNIMSEDEKTYFKKLLKKISHEANAYLKLGGDKYMGFVHLLLRKIEQ